MKRRWGRRSLYAKSIAILLGFVSVAVASLAVIGLRGLSDINEENGLVRVDRAGRAAAEAAMWGDFGMVSETTDGSPQRLVVADAEVLAPSEEWDAYVDRVSTMNQGAANIFRLNPETGGFDRLSTSFRDDDGNRVAEGLVTPDVIAAGHPAHQSLTAGTRFVGEVPVKGRLRLAYLTPVVDPAGSVVGAIAVDVGWVDDLKRANADAARKVTIATGSLLGVFLLSGAYFMTRAFRPLRGLGKIAGAVGRGEAVEQIPHQERHDEIGNIANGLAQVVDLQTELRTLAYVDDLTGLPNRARFTQELDARVVRATADPETDGFVLLLLDLDQFKQVNDALGHAAGDRLLRAVADRLRELPLGDVLRARIGGDEFAVLSSGPLSDQRASEMAEVITTGLVDAARAGTGDIKVSCSVGIVRVPSQAKNSAETLSHADLALYQAKRNGRGRSEFYRPSLSTDAQRRLHLTTDLGDAMGTDQIRIDLQPQFDLADDAIVGYEALARWDHPEEGPIPPAEFIDVAESAGLITDLGAHVLDLSLATARQLIDDGARFESISVNVSPIQLWQGSFVGTVIDCLEHHRIAPEQLCLEITENVLVDHDDDRTWARLRQLSKLGVRLSIDDFGTGYCSLSYLDHLPFDQLKVDQTFVGGLDLNPRRKELFAGIVSLGQSLGLEVVVEGIERPEELEIVCDLGVQVAQGYLLGQPVPAREAPTLTSTGVIADVLRGPDPDLQRI